jgi:hypothetical protein
MEKSAGAARAQAVGELAMRPVSFEFPRLFSEQNQRLLELMTDFNTTSGEFLRRRGNRNTEAFSRLMQSTNPADAFLLQAQWFRDAADDYMKEAARISDAWGRVFGSARGLAGAAYHAPGMGSERPSTPAARPRQ